MKIHDKLSIFLLLYQWPQRKGRDLEVSESKRSQCPGTSAELRWSRRIGARGAVGNGRLGYIASALLIPSTSARRCQVALSVPYRSIALGASGQREWNDRPTSFRVFSQRALSSEALNQLQRSMRTRIKAAAALESCESGRSRACCWAGSWLDSQRDWLPVSLHL